MADRKIVCLARCKGTEEDRNEAARELHKDIADLDEMYQGRAVTVFEELTYDRSHVEIRIAAVAARDGKPGNDVHALIDACRWAALAQILVKDKVLAQQLSQTENFLPKTMKNSWSK